MSNREEAERLALVYGIGGPNRKHCAIEIERAIAAAESRGRAQGLEEALRVVDELRLISEYTGERFRLAQSDVFIAAIRALASKPATPEGEVVKCEHEWCRELDRIKCLNCGENCEPPRQGVLRGFAAYNLPRLRRYVHRREVMGEQVSDQERIVAAAIYYRGTSSGRRARHGGR